jgi:gliding motility-associated-like protein
MKKHLLAKIITGLVIIVFFSPLTSYATHVQGGNITYKCLGGNQYEVSLALYRDCAGATAPTSVSINRKSVSCGINSNFTLNKITGTGIEVTPICPSLATQCTGGSYPGVQEYIYRGIVTLPPCSDWVLSYSLCCRNNAIGTILSPSSQNMYIEATLNNLAFPCNDSPEFTNRPVPFICVGQPFCFNNGSIDSDGDSLSYSLITPRHSATVFVTYIAPYSASQPLASSPACTFNPLTGDMCVTPTMLQVTVFTVLVREWRGGILVGSVMRDIQMRTVTCTNNNPYLNGINNTGSYTLNACAGVPISFNIPSFDADATQNVTLTWNAGIPGGSFNPGTGTRPTGVFTWTPTLADVGTTSHCFTVLVKDNNCPFNGSQTYSFCITVGGFTVVPTTTPATCTSSNGSASLAVTGGAEPLNYAWTPSLGTGTSLTNIPAGSYTYTVTDAVGCPQTATLTVPSVGGGTAAVSSFTNVSCNGGANGSISVSMSGATTPPFTYAWTPASAGNTATVTNLPAGNYTATVTDANGCVSTITQTITQPAPLTVNPTYTNVGCYGGSSGTATGTAAGGTGPYTYLWMPGAYTTSSISSLPVGTYSVTVTDSKGCTASASAAISQPPVLAISSASVNASCGMSNGSASVTGSGGFAPYTWSWSNGQTGPSATGLAAGTYTVTITDLNFCTMTAPVTVGNTAGPTATITTYNNPLCFGVNNGNATVAVSGGTGPFTYLWNNGQTTATATNLVAGIYSVIVTDALGCSATANITLTQPTALVVNAVSTNPVCFGNSNGTATASSLGGTAPYSYVWTSAGSPTTATVSGLPAGMYTVTSTDANGCIQTASVTLSNPPTISTTITPVMVSCNGGCNGTALATPSGGFAPYTYLWNNPSAQTTATATGLCAGSYTVSVTDAHGCPSQAVANITQPTALSATLSSVGHLTCYNVCTGFAQVTATGGTAPYTYAWSPGGATTSTATALCAGTYTCTITDSKGCTAVVTAVITQPTQLMANVVGSDISCAGTCNGSGNIGFSGGTPPYTFLWTPGLQTIYNPADLCPGVNTATITDANGCTTSQSITLVESYPPLLVTTSVTNSNCGQANGAACAAVSGGLAPYSYVWSDTLVSMTACMTGVSAGTYTVDVADANGCLVNQVANINDISAPDVVITGHTDLLCFGAANGTATTSITGGIAPYTIVWTPGGQTIANPVTLSAGVNSITVTDNAGCISSASVTILQPPAINHAIASVTDVTCFGLCNGSATVVAAGGTPPLTFSWNDPASQTTATASSLCAGNYEVLISDANGCVASDSATVVTEPGDLAIVSSAVQNVSCAGFADGSISTVVTGGTPFYVFSWTPAVGSDPSAAALSPGTYSLTVTDQNGCSTSGTWNITEPLPLANAVSFDPSTCGLANGSATSAASGGTSPYSWQWNDAALQTSATATGLVAGTYEVLLTDDHGCSITANTSINDLPGPVIDSISTTPVLCHGGITGSATVILVPGTGSAPFLFEWSPGGSSSATASSLVAGAYTVVVSDTNGCSASGVGIITEPPLLELFVSVSDTICVGDTTQVYASASGGTLPYAYTWLPTPGFSGPGPHITYPENTVTYTAMVTDNNGCVDGPLNISVFVKPPVSVIATDVTVCAGDAATISAVAAGGDGGPYTYSWSNGSSGASQTVPTAAGTSEINLIVTAADGCSTPGTDTATITINPGSIAGLVGSTLSGCEPLSVNFTGVSDNGVNYYWSYGDSGTGSGSATTHVFTDDGTYTITLTVVTAAGCSTTVSNINYINVHPLPNASFSASPSPATSLAPTVNFTDLSTDMIVSWYWDFGDPMSTADYSSSQHPSYMYSEPGTNTVMLVVTNQYGCVDTAYSPVEIIDDYAFYVPNAFTPDGDGINDVFIPKGVGYDEDSYSFLIFDRWGNMIFSSDDPEKGWNGIANHGSEIAQMDVYVWKVNVKDNRGLMHRYIGQVTLVK